MIELEFLGLNADGDKLTFNDPEGNRYQVGITDELNVAVRKLQLLKQTENSSTSPLKYRDIQQLLRAGKTLEELALQTDIPMEQLDKIAYPILAEREYRARQAQSFMPAGEDSGMTLSELVEARLLTRSVNPNQIRWDATRDANSPWILWAYYSVKDENLCAKWAIDEAKQSLRALNDEAAWITENPLKATSEPWRPLNTPKVSAIDLMAPVTSDSQVSTTSADSATVAQLSPEIYSETAVTALAQEAEDKVSSEAETEEGFSISEPEITTGLDLDAILAELDAQRGIAKPMPSIDEFIDGAHPAASEPELATDATIIKLQPVKELDTSDSFTDSVDEHEIPDFTIDPEDDYATNSDFAEDLDSEVENEISADSSNTVDAPEEAELAQVDDNTDSKNTEISADQSELPGLGDLKDSPVPVEKDAAAKTNKPKSRRDRPAMPSWDEIVFGYSKD
ncbi:MAG: septation protein SepH [Arcanobacterium sp.]|nr:septation protein SepH [Arcanobacterium sp.]